ncbi:MAG TPA: hypothetical protein PKA63_08510 [Oligoflexia bacterium]|nr:hypothetical protein [Oligoflexia bacterium]HMP48692.1 hypothetical protein [Oligoflexia bacterium]
MENSSVILPFYGIRTDDFAPFQYIPLEFSFDKSYRAGKILIPNWAVTRERLSEGETVDLQVGITSEQRVYSNARVVSLKLDSSRDGMIYELEFFEESNNSFLVNLRTTDNKGSIDPVFKIDSSYEKSNFHLLIGAIKNCWMLKRGIAIYLRHLIPYFTRIAELSKDDYQILKSTLLEEPLERIDKNAMLLEDLYNDLLSQNSSLDDFSNTKDTNINIAVNVIPKSFDLNEFASSLTSELELELFAISFNSELAISYLRSIKNLEGRYFSNYNLVLVVYTQELLN